MNDPRIELLRQAVGEAGSQSAVARRLGYSSAAISQVMNGKYGGDIGAILTRVDEVYGNRTMDCPVLGEIPLGRCAEQRRRPFSSANGLAVQLFRACKQCVNNR